MKIHQGDVPTWRRIETVVEAALQLKVDPVGVARSVLALRTVPSTVDTSNLLTRKA
jgi:hypothetical protein